MTEPDVNLVDQAWSRFVKDWDDIKAAISKMHPALLHSEDTATATNIDEPAEITYERKRRLAEWDRENS